MRSSSFLLFITAAITVSPAFSVTISESSQLKSSTYDYIIVGAGNAGLVVANRLTEDPSVSVLVLEAGVSDQGMQNVQIPFLGPTLTPNTPIDWNYTVVPQRGMNNRVYPYPRGKILGGSSSVNYLFHQFGSNDDWNRLASVSGDSGWSWSNIKKYVQKHERIVPPVDGHNTAGQFIPQEHGFKGELPVSLPGFNQSIDPLVIKATSQVPGFPFNEDMAGGDRSLLGVGWLQSSAGGGVRSTSSTSYLANANKRPNLTVLINATVRKLVQTANGKRGAKAFRSVQFSPTPVTGKSGAGGHVITVTARKEVILSAGSVGTPQILQLSGIGNASDLKKLSIPSTINNANVGKHLSDHTFLGNMFSVNSNSTFDHIFRDSSLVNDERQQWVNTKTGIFANNVINNFGFARVANNATIFKSHPDPAAGPQSPHWELIFANMFFSPNMNVSTPDTGNFLTVLLVLVSPTSRGSVTITSNNPFDAPAIDPNMLTTDFDIFAMVDAIKNIKRFVSAPAFKGFVEGPFGAFAQAQTDAEIEAYVRAETTTIFHPTGTASMAKASSNDGVVNPDLTVKGADGLRIVDGSVFPFIPSCHPQGPIYLLAERASDIIKGAK
ncbi:hypothetical protein D9619_013247 [Psilocybe cf. subviscida]|uniref:pyranose dehydrogenase (acceptor) n=1 Tax=Psilocybe cf. subviscida TaxID=2480587 RepID=A0A8H5BS73_9AGAR|nr:hypothetical protein D9619_013247 [Psilocybe cf. subviscida]